MTRVLTRLAAVAEPLPLALGGTLWLVARLVGDSARWQAWALWSSPLGMGLLAVALIEAAGPWCRAHAEAALGMLGPRRLACLGGLLLLIAGQHHAVGLHASGDEPHYLLMAQSLWGEHDLDLRDNFERGEFREYVPRLPAPHYGAPRADGRPFPAHSPGLPLLLAPVYALGGRGACLALLALLATLTIYHVQRLALELGAAPGAAAWSGLLACGPPLGFYAFHIYTEVPTALLLVWGARQVAAAWGQAGQPSRAASVRAAVAACLLPWLHVKALPAAALLGAGALWNAGRRRLPVALLLASGLAAYAAYHAAIFGQLTPLALYGGGLPRGVQATPLLAAAGLLLDRSFGVLPHAPALLLGLAAAGLPRVSTPAPSGRRLLWALCAAVAAPVLFWRMWWGGQCPPGRLLVPLVPLLAVLAALRITRAPLQGLARARWGLLAAGWLLAGYMVWHPAERLLLNRRDRPTRVWSSLSGAAESGDLGLGAYLPGLVVPQPADRRLAGLWLAFAAALLWADRREQARAGRAGLAWRWLPWAAPFLLVLLVDGLGWRAGRAAPAAAPALTDEQESAAESE